MASYEAEYGYPKADVSTFSNVVHILPPDEDGPTNEDGMPVHSNDYAVRESTILEYPETIEDEELRRRVEDSEELDEETMKAVGEHYAHDLEAVPCNRCARMVWTDEWRGFYARNHCSVCAGECPNCGADKDEYWETIRTSRRTRVPNRYKCTNCGYTKNGITTG